MSGQSRFVAGAAALLLAATVLGTLTLGGSAAATGARRAASVGAAGPPATITATPIRRRPGTVAVGTRVKASQLGQRVFINNQVGFALGSVGQAQYPAKTTDGGGVWKTFGPAVHVDAAQAPLSVTEIGVENAATVYFYGSGQVVDSTGDGGKHWWQALTQGLSAAVVPFGGHLLWFTQTTTVNSNRALTWVYSSTDGGRVWHYTTAVGG